MGYFDNYPKHVFLILTNEFCERFSYYGMKAILVLFLTNALNFDDDTATAIYHAFNVVCYFTPIFGAMISDGWLGKFRTILYVSIVYGIGNIIMTFSAIPYGGSYIVWLPFIGMALIALGTGGIKPCVSAFGGDQFTTEQRRQKDSFFSLFYMSINVGSLLSTIITPIIRSQVFCFGESCYALAFGIPAALMITSIFIFAAGYRWYTKYPAGDNILGRMFGCIWKGIKGKCSCSKHKEKKDHWLDYAEDDYDKQFVSDMKDVMRVLWMFLPLPMFWALFDQQGSRWTLQATQMNGEFGSFVMQPDMMQVFNPLFVVILVPILESLIYPCLDKHKVPNRPLQRMSLGMILAATAFLYAAFLQIAVDNSAPPVAGGMEAQYMFINSAGCSVSLNVTDKDSSKTSAELPVLSLEGTEYFYMKLSKSEQDVSFRWTESCSNISSSNVFTFKEKKGYLLIINSDASNLTAFQQEDDYIKPTPQSASSFQFYNTLSTNVTITLHATKGQQEDVTLTNILPNNVSSRTVLTYAEYDVTVQNGTSNTSTTLTSKLSSKTGAVYTVLLRSDGDNYSMKVVTEIGPRTVNIFLQVPQYFIITFGECLFSVTGLGFAYSQAPPTMKSILTACWHLTVAVGNVVVIIVAETGSAMSQMGEFFLFSLLMYVTTAIFAIMGWFYTYANPRSFESELNLKSETSDDKHGTDNEAVERHDYDNISYHDKKEDKHGAGKQAMERHDYDSISLHEKKDHDKVSLDNHDDISLHEKKDHDKVSLDRKSDHDEISLDKTRNIDDRDKASDRKSSTASSNSNESGDKTSF